MTSNQLTTANPAVIENFFICVGAQKSGTTWLARILADHPDLFLSPVKELHYFDHVAGITQHLSSPKRRSRYRKYHQRMWTQWHRFGHYRSQWAWYKDYMRPQINDDWYRALFTHRAGKTFAGEVTPEYAILGQQGYRHLHKLAPAARVLFIMRNPVSQAWSQVLHHCRSHDLDAASLSTDRVLAMLDEPRFREISDYETTLRDLAAVFADNQLLFLYFEEMHADRNKALAQVCAFIGTSFEPAMIADPAQRFNRSQNVALPEAVRDRLQHRFQPLAKLVQAHVGHIPQAWRDEFSL